MGDSNPRHLAWYSAVCVHVKLLLEPLQQITVAGDDLVCRYDKRSQVHLLHAIHPLFKSFKKAQTEQLQLLIHLDGTERGIPSGKQTEILELVVHGSFGHDDESGGVCKPAELQAIVSQGIAPWHAA